MLSTLSTEIKIIGKYKGTSFFFLKHGIASSIWNYKSDDMGLLNGENLKNEAVIKAVMEGRTLH